MTTAAMLALLGLPSLRYLHTHDPDERSLLRALARQADSLRLELEERQARCIANAFVKAKLHG